MNDLLLINLNFDLGNLRSHRNTMQCVIGNWLLGYVHTGTISYGYRTGLIFGTEKLTVHTGPLRYRTSFGTCSHGYGIVSFRSISRQSKQKKI